MKILVLGKTGMLGNVVYNYFKDLNEDVIGTSRNKEDIYYDAYENQEGIVNIIRKYRPNVIINCIGILNKEAEDNKCLAIKVNSLLPHYIDSLSDKYNFKLIHISTDCVFEGTKGNYTETDIADATSFYGRSKAMGEIVNNKNVTLRTSIIGPDNNKEGIGLFEWFINQEGEINGYKNVLWTGVTTIELAKVIETVIKNNIVGLQHVVNNEIISKYDLLKLISKVFNKEIKINEEVNNKSAKTLIRTNKSFDYEIPSYEKMIKEMKEWIIKHKNIYTNSSVRRYL